MRRQSVNRYIVRRLFAASLFVSLGSCNNAVTSSPTSPSRPAQPSTHVVSGTITERLNGVSRPAALHKVDVYISGSTCVAGQAAPCVAESAEVVETDQNGRYALTVTAYPKTLVFVAGAGLHALGRQPCLASALVDNDVTIRYALRDRSQTLTSNVSGAY